MYRGPSDSAREMAPTHPQPGNRGITVAALGRSAAAAAGAVAGLVLAVLVAIPLGPLLFSVLFEYVGLPIVEWIIFSGGRPDMSSLEGFITGVFLMIAGVALAIAVAIVTACVVIVLVAPIFVLVPLLATATVLRLVGAGMIIRTLWLMLGMIVALAIAILPTFPALHIGAHRWVWIAIVAGGASVGRLVVELWKPELANKPADVAAIWKRWKRVGTAWLVFALVAIVSSFLLSVYLIHP
jgi:hypothetical protein